MKNGFQSTIARRSISTTTYPQDQLDNMKEEPIEKTATFKEALLNKEATLNKSYSYHPYYTANAAEADGGSIELMEEDKIRIYQPWKYPIILKLFRKKLAHPYLRSKLQEL